MRILDYTTVEQASKPAAPKIDTTTRVLEGLSVVFAMLACASLALNLPFSPVGWVFGTLSALVGIPWSIRIRAHMFMCMQFVYVVLNSIGIYRSFVPYFKSDLMPYLTAGVM